MRRRQEDIKSKGFSMGIQEDTDFKDITPIEYNKMRVGLKSLDDAVLNLGSFKKTNANYGDKRVVMQALANHDYPLLREISNFYYETSGIYSRMCKYLAYLYRFDWYVVPFIVDDATKKDKILGDFSKILSYLDSSNIKKLCRDISLQVIKSGCYYGYIVPNDEGIVLQELPVSYCRSRFYSGQNAAVEFNMRFFDDKFSDTQYRLRVLKMFPLEFSKAYVLYKEGKLKGDFSGDTSGWYLLDPEMTVKFNVDNSDCPILTEAIPAILDLDSAQDLDRRKMMQKLLKIVIQKLPTDKNGDLIFDVDEAKDLHNNAVEMLSRAIGVDVLTTFADIEVADMSDKNTATTTDDLMKVERTVYNNLGVSQNLFNTDGNIALEKSILNDEASVRNLVFGFQSFLNKCIQPLSQGKKKYHFRLFMLETTIYNYMELSKQYKEQVQIGYSKMLPQIALGHSQSAIIATAQFEKNILELQEIMVPPMSSNTMSKEDLGTKEKESSTKNGQGAGRPSKPDSEKSTKTIQNKEAMG